MLPAIFGAVRGSPSHLHWLPPTQPWQPPRGGEGSPEQAEDGVIGGRGPLVLAKRGRHPLPTPSFFVLPWPSVQY